MSLATAVWLSGPVLRARPKGPFLLREAVTVGPDRLLGEVMRIARDEIVVQVYEDTSGLRPGVEVRGSGRLLSIRLGPGILGNIFDGLLRPITDSVEPYVNPGMRELPAADFGFHPKVEVGGRLGPGETLGKVRNGDGQIQRCLVPPDLPAGEVIEIADAGDYLEDEIVCRVRDQEGRVQELAMGHRWPVRIPRPVTRRLRSDEPMLTGQRILDCLFPVARGGTAAIPGGFGTGKTVLLETIAKWCDADVIVYVGCGERGNEMAGLLDEFSELEDPRSGRQLLERTVVIANTSNMPVSAREASIYTGVTVAEYFRDQGLQRGPDGGLHQPLGRGPARGLRTPGRAARRERLSGLSEQPPGGLLRACGQGAHPGRRRGVGDPAGGGEPAVGRLLRAGHHPYQALRPGACGRWTRAAPRPASIPPSTRCSPTASSPGAWRAGGMPRTARAGRSCGGAFSPCWRRRPGSSAWPASSAETPCRSASA